MPTEDELEQMLTARESPFTEEERELIRKAMKKDGKRVREIAESIAGKEPDDELLALYKGYCNELSEYDDEEYPEGQDERVLREYQANPDVKIHEITLDGAKIGFLILLTNKKVSDVIICEAYVLPAFRGNGYMSRTVEAAIKPYTSVRFVVFNQNPAKEFWEKVMKRIGRAKISSAPYERQFTEYLYW